jgi:hypothetical protein
MVPTGNSSVDSTIWTAEAIRQTAVSIATTQAGVNTATVTFYRSVLAAKRTAGLDVGNEIIALENLGATV